MTAPESRESEEDGGGGRCERETRYERTPKPALAREKPWLLLPHAQLSHSRLCRRLLLVLLVGPQSRRLDTLLRAREGAQKGHDWSLGPAPDGAGKVSLLSNREVEVETSGFWPIFDTDTAKSHGAGKEAVTR